MADAVATCSARAPSSSPEAVLGRIGRENFPVALRWLPRALRRDLIAIYGVARLIDEAGDAARGDRAALLDALEGDLLAAFAGEARHPLLRRLTPLAAAHGLAPDPFLRLIAANRFDQSAPDLASWDALRRLLPALRAAGRRARAARVRPGQRREPARLGRRLHRAPGARALPGRRRGRARGALLSARRRPRARTASARGT